MEKVLNAQVAKQVNDAFAEMKEPVQVLYCGSKDNCEYCSETQQLLEEVAATHDKLELSVYDMDEHQDVARQFNVTNAPGIVIAAKDGIVSRGILLDVAKAAGREFLDPGDAASPDDVREAIEIAGVEPEAGDILIFRTGRHARNAIHGIPPQSAGLAGISVACGAISALGCSAVGAPMP